MGTLLLRYGEIALKGKNRTEFLRRLRANVRAALKDNGLQGVVRSVGQRVYVETDTPEQAIEPVSHVFGLVSLSEVIQVERDIDAIAAECVRQARRAGVGSPAAPSFRVRARRSDKTFPYISPQIDRIAGEAIFAELGGRVDLSNDADVTIGAEVARDVALIYGNVVPAPGGLPVGVEGRVVALLSGGIDSPVAAWLMMKRGCAVIPVHFSSSESETAKVMDNIAQLSRYSAGWTLRPTIVDHEQVIAPILERLRELGEERWSCVFCKRAIITHACELARQLGAQAIVMGDSLGQVASQTLPNMAVISHGMPLPILRPLIGMDKQEIVDLARRIGTFDVSTRSETSCRYLPTHPLTRGTLERMLEISAAAGVPSADDGARPG